MRALFIPLFFLLLAGAAPHAGAQDLKAYDAEAFLKRVSNKDTIYVVNFWATWCVPCVKELPEFDRMDKYFADKPVKVLLVSFDFKEQYPNKIEDWIKKRKLRPEVVWFSETNPTSYIPKIAPGWEGALPATLLINNQTGQRELLAREIKDQEIEQWVDAQLTED